MKALNRWLPWVAAALCVITLGLLLADLLMPKADLFLNEPVKLVLLIACLACGGCGVLLASKQRRRARKRRGRR